MDSRSAQENKPHRKSSSFISSAIVSTVHTCVFHPVDTICKRLQTQGNIQFHLSGGASFASQMKRAIYPANHSPIWSGFREAFIYRVSICTVTFGAQSSVNSYLAKKYNPLISKYVGQKYQSTVTNTLSGSVFGILDLLLLPVDKIKIQRQLHNTTPYLSLINTERLRLFSGIGITAVRNVTGYAALFGTSDFVKVNYCKPTESAFEKSLQSFGCAFAGAVSSVLVSNPSDVIKTGVQAQLKNKHSENLSAIAIAKKVYAENGLKGFARGVYPRLFTVVPRITLLKALSEQLTPIVDEKLEHFAKKR